jgi:hypothetical protein
MAPATITMLGESAFMVALPNTQNSQLGNTHNAVQLGGTVPSLLLKPAERPPSPKTSRIVTGIVLHELHVGVGARRRSSFSS